MEILSIGINHPHGRYFCINRPKGGGTWLLLLVKTASFMHIQGKRIDMPPNTLVIYSPQHPQCYGAVDEQYVDDWMHFMITPADQELLDRHPLPFDTPIALPNLHELSDVMRKLCYEFHSRRPFREEYLESCLKLLVISIHQHLENMQGQVEGPLVPHSDKLMSLRAYIRAGAYIHRGIDDMARDYFMGRSNLQHLYRRCFGTTIREDMMAARLFVAKHYLATTALPVAEIARTCGYSSEPHFMTVFKAKTGMTPSQYRNSP